MRGINRIVLMGNLGKDPDIKTLGSGDLLALFPLATTEMWKHEGEKKEEVSWHNVVCWKGIAESVRDSELKKSDCVYLEGKLKYKKYTDKEGNQKLSIDIVVDLFIIVKRHQVKEIVTQDE
jgi:single-strand DNA-binding protein